jgi:hypothetical protein
VKNAGLGLGAWGEGLPAADSCRHQLVNSSCGSRKRTNLEKKSLKMNELCGNVYENKGSLLKEWRRSGNVIENKGTYGLKAGIVLKLQVVSVWWVGKNRFQVSRVSGARCHIRIQEPGYRREKGGTGYRGRGKGLLLNCGLSIAFLLLVTTDCLLPTAFPHCPAA